MGLSTKDEVFLKMGIEAKGKIEYRPGHDDFTWEIEVHHIGPDDMQSRTRIGFKTSDEAFGSMATNFGDTVRELIEEYNSN